MAEILNFKPALARQRGRRAERSINRANELLDEDCGVGLSLALCGSIRSAQSRVIDARTRFLKIRPTAHY
ncbi:MAG: hypothetical protein EOS58_07315 [Mesorhizobium sp.]|uniref:hypothetical protein n=1 Tax=Mesorhizobium sp. M4B.F.Ca.ET.058.02.1.1 TaxID=2493675 RepID=UPI000F7641EA|nr:hypothetical protein [Mesorhizobium sp. M4B.F.Ca.ET.058.02.1.1]RVC44047.1 hypothetical protein EN781_15630 [Mesorhizobium sp. M4A.F.Ca.ET.090.04.2.1]RVD73337.1 hypothetical protein EN751_05355 [Mesorhizobium sp. M4A.F.Ca.ET.029.04.2.1]RWC54335.1 MAG: hypothetical protein EOS54_10770 [Mesorhizobium sp.]AZO47017.1 hypothetical protein EJ073_03665 [Mesorhizobium sp. M4B.F.Ca.ET.058.02.1.1]RWD06806.1 MAG: hypothetical protein EOS58_07315 [Mesorhizobium sp.]